jgi:hypothetical protein
VGLRANALADRKTVEPGHPHVQEHAIEALAFERGETLDTVRGEDDRAALVFQRALGEEAVSLVVVDDEDLGRWLFGR